MHRRLSSRLTGPLAGVALLALLTGLPAGALAQDQAPAAAPAAPATEAPAQPDPKAVVATVGGDAITEADLGFAAEDLRQELQQVPPEQRRAFLVTVLIDMKVMARAARDARMDQTDDFKQRLGYLEDRALRRAYFSDKVASEVNEAAVRKAYDEYAKAFQPQEEVHAEHILVKTEAEAKDIEKQLDGGASFEDLAKAKSTDKASGAKGGDLGYFTQSQMVKPFADAAFALDVGQVSDPVQSQFGWHIIKVLDKKKTEPAPIEQVAPQLQQQLMYKTFDDAVIQLKKGMTIDIPDPKLADEVKQQQGEAAAPAGQ